MNKINQTLRVIGAGARANKYRVRYPVFGDEIDVLCNATTMPGREVGIAEVFVKGRKIQLAGEMADDGTWEMTIYNTPDLFHRRFFLKLLSGIHSFNTPDYLQLNESLENSDLNGGNNLSASGSKSAGGGSGGFGGFLGDVSDAVSKINGAYNDVKNALGSVKRAGANVKGIINGDWSALETILGNTGYGTPWYMQEIIIEQLGENGQVTASTILHNAFVTQVSAIDYSDETAEISTSVITFAYSGISYGDYNEIPSVESY